jgi:hypothetical protein
MHNPSTEYPFAELVPGTSLGELRVTISPAANERYWRAAGADHPTLRAGALYPPIAANLTVLLFGQVCPDPVIQTTQGLRCHRAAGTPAELVARGSVVRCYAKRGRSYVDLEVAVTIAGEPEQLLWESSVTFTPTATLGTPTATLGGPS